VLGHGSTPHDKADDMWESFHTQDGLNTQNVEDVDQDNAGRLWVATSPRWTGSEYAEGGLSVLDDGGTPFEKSDDNWMVYRPEDSGGGFNGWVQQIALDGDRRVWSTTTPRWEDTMYVGGGLSLLDHGGTPFDKTDDTWTTFTISDGLTSNWGYAVTLDSSGNVWVGTGYGVNVLDTAGTPFDGTDDSWTAFTMADGLISSSVVNIHLASAGQLWVATTKGASVLDAGGTPFDKSDDDWLTLGVSDGLADEYVLSVAADPSGAVWFGTAAGLSRLGGATSYRVYLPLAARRSAP
jgi:hypothetical protein